MGDPSSDTNPNLRPAEARWTHVALRVRDIDATIAWYEEFTPLELIERRADDTGFGAWLGMPGPTNNPFILVVAQFLPHRDPFANESTATLTPFAHLGIELPNRDDVDAVAERAEAADCLAMEPTALPAPIGYIATLRDPDGNLVEFSWDQGVYSALHQRWSQD